MRRAREERHVTPTTLETSLDSQRITRRPWLFLLAPALTLLVGAPLAGMPFSGDPRGGWAPYTLLALPFYFGLAAAPGYLATLLVDVRWLHATPVRRWWARLSLLTGLLCGSAGAAGGFLMVLFLVPGLLTFIGCFILWARFERVGRAVWTV